jgi:hypothetical protein
MPTSGRTRRTGAGSSVSVRLAVDDFADDPDEGRFRIHLTSGTTRWLVLDTVVEASALDELRALVESELERWSPGAVKVTRLDRHYSQTDDDA